MDKEELEYIKNYLEDDGLKVVYTDSIHAESRFDNIIRILFQDDIFCAFWESDYLKNKGKTLRKLKRELVEKPEIIKNFRQLKNKRRAIRIRTEEIKQLEWEIKTLKELINEEKARKELLGDSNE